MDNFEIGIGRSTTDPDGPNRTIRFEADRVIAAGSTSYSYIFQIEDLYIGERSEEVVPHFTIRDGETGEELFKLEAGDAAVLSPDSVGAIARTSVSYASTPEVYTASVDFNYELKHVESSDVLFTGTLSNSVQTLACTPLEPGSILTEDFCGDVLSSRGEYIILTDYREISEEDLKEQQNLLNQSNAIELNLDITTDQAADESLIEIDFLLALELKPLIYLDFSTPIPAKFKITQNSFIQFFNSDKSEKASYELDGGNFRNLSNYSLSEQKEIRDLIQATFVRSDIDVRVTLEKPVAGPYETVLFGESLFYDRNGDGSINTNPNSSDYEAYGGLARKSATTSLKQMTVDRFNEEKNGFAYILADKAIPTWRAAGWATHEIGHLYGIPHLDPLPNSSSEVMDYAIQQNVDEVFYGQPTLLDADLRDGQPGPSDGETRTNPQFHIRQYVVGEDANDIIADGLVAGNYENKRYKQPDTTVSVEFGGSDFATYSIYAKESQSNPQFGVDDHLLAVVRPTDLINGLFEFEIEPGESFEIIGSTTDDGPFDLRIAPENSKENGIFTDPEVGEIDAVFQFFDENLQQVVEVGELTVSVTDNVEPTPINFILGTEFNDGIMGTIGNDRIDALMGDDRVNSGEGNDAISGGDGNDILIGFTGDDILNGGAGRDVIRGGAGSDQAFGDAGVDIVRGGGGNDYVEGGDGGTFGDAQIVSGDRGEDEVHGGSGVDTVRGGDGNDLLYGGAGADRVVGDRGDDQIFGEDGNDVVLGAIGNDILNGGAGNDRLVGGNVNDRGGVSGGGEDIFVFTPGTGIDIVLDFEDGADLIDISAYGFSDIDPLLSTAREAASGGVILTLNQTDAVILRSNTIEELGADDFIFS